MHTGDDQELFSFTTTDAWGGTVTCTYNEHPARRAVIFALAVLEVMKAFGTVDVGAVDADPLRARIEDELKRIWPEWTLTPKESRHALWLLLNLRWDKAIVDTRMMPYPGSLRIRLE